MTKMEALKPCPFCGKPTRGVIEDHHPRAGKYFHVSCGNRACEMQPETLSYKNPEAAIAAWNQRSGEEHLSPFRDRIAMLEEALRDIEGKCADTIAGRINYRAGDLQIIARAALSNQGRL